MKLELKRKEFLKSWQTAERFAGTKSVSEAAQGIYIKASEDGQVTLKATDLKTSVKLKAEGVNILEPGEAVIPVLIFGSMLKKAEEDELLIDITTERGFMKSGKNKTKFAVIPPDRFPAISESPDGEEVCTVRGGILAQLILEGNSAASLPDDYPKYLGTCLLRTMAGSVRIVSTDGKRLSLSQWVCDEVKADKDLILPALAMKELGKNLSAYEDKGIRISANEYMAWFSADDIEFSLQLVDAAFPKYERILNDVIQTSLKVKGSDLTSALERIDIIARTKPARTAVLSLNPDGVIKITARSPEAGMASEEFFAEIDGEPMTVGFTVGYFLDGLKVLGTDDICIEFSGAETQLRMKRRNSDDFLYMLMPARLSEQDKFSEDELQ